MRLISRIASLLFLLTAPLSGAIQDPREMASLELFLISTTFEESHRAGQQCTGSGTPWVACTGSDPGDMPMAYDRMIADCTDWSTCANTGSSESEDISLKYCDADAVARANAVGYAPNGCVRWWTDYSLWDCSDHTNYGEASLAACGTKCCNHSTAESAHKDEWFQGHELGQDDHELPALVRDKFNGHPGVWFPGTSDMFSEAVQPAGLELQSFDVFQFDTGAFTLFVLAETANPMPSNEWCFMGSATDCFGVDSNNDAVGLDLTGTHSTNPSLDAISESDVVTPGTLQLFEVHRDASGYITFYVDGVDVTTGTPQDTGSASFRYFGTNYANAGGVASDAIFGAVLVFSSDLGTVDSLSVRDYLDRIYNWSGNEDQTPQYHTSAGYTARANGFDLDQDGTPGESSVDDLICDHTTGTGPQTEDLWGDATNEQQYYVDCDNGDNGDTGGPSDPWATIDYAMTNVDGPGTGGADIVCFKGTCREQAIYMDLTGGAQTGYTISASGNLEYDIKLPDNPAMLVGWDADNDNSYPPFDTDDTSEFAGGRDLYDDTCLRDVFTMAGGSQAITGLEMAHFKVRDYGTCVAPVSGDEFNSRFIMFNPDTSISGNYLYFHDIEFENFNRGNQGGTVALFYAFTTGSDFDYVTIDNIRARYSGNYLWRGECTSTANECTGWTLKNITFISQNTPYNVLNFKPWGEYDDVQLIDSYFQADQWELVWDYDYTNPNEDRKPGWSSSACIQGLAVRGNEMRDTAGLAGLSADETGCNTRATNDTIYDKNIWHNDWPYHKNTACFSFSDGDATVSPEGVLVTNNACIFNATAQLVESGLVEFDLDADPTASGFELYNNTVISSAVLSGGGVNFYSSNVEDDITIKNNIFGNAGTLGVDADMEPAGLVSDYNIWPSGATFNWGTDTGQNLNWWQESGDGPQEDSNSLTCSPTFAADGFHLSESDTCAKGAATSLSGTFTLDFDGGTRVDWDIGADEEGVGADPEEPAAVGFLAGGTMTGGRKE